MSQVKLHVAKQNLKFSSAHFLIFNSTEAEKLHGHNYQVKCDLHFKSPEGKDPQGYTVDFQIIKKIIKAHVDLWDEHVLLPELQPEMMFVEEGPSLEVRFRDRLYVFPKNEVVLLPLVNTSVEGLAELLANNLFLEFKKYDVLELELSIEETPGQGAVVVVR